MGVATLRRCALAVGTLPRYRLYTSPSTYLGCLTRIALGRATKGDDDRVFERRVAERTGAAYAVCLPSATAGIFLVLRALITPGQKVILSPYTISDAVNMVVCAGGVPVFADIDRVSCHIDPDEIERLIDRQTGAVIVTHMHGYSCEMDRIVLLCRAKGIPLVEDAAQSFGASYRSKLVGTFGDAGIFSFGMYKNVCAFLGGMVVTPHKHLHDRVRRELEEFPLQEMRRYLLRVLYGVVTDVATFPPLFRLITARIFRAAYLRDIRVLNSLVSVETNPRITRTVPTGYLRRMMPVQARLALAQMDHVDRDSDSRIAFARMYYEALKEIPELIVAPLHEDRSHIYTYFPIRVPDRTALLKWLMSHGCDVAASHLKNCADLPAFTEFYRDCPNARATADSLVLLPTYPRYSEGNVRRNIEIIRAFFA